jgi:hypothetical protein
MSKSKVIAMLLLAACAAFFARGAHSENSYQVKHTVRFSPQDFSPSKVMGYDLFRLHEGGYLAELGKPMLPCREIKVALPQGMAVTAVRVVDSTGEEMEGVFDILPSQPPRETGLSDQDADFVGPDQKTYRSSQAYPGELAQLVRQTDLAGQSMAVVRLFPLQYTPAEKKLVLYTSISLEIEGVAGYQCKDYLSARASEDKKEIYRQMVEGMVENPEQVRLAAGPLTISSQVPGGGPFDHVIITSSALAPDMEPLAFWHTRKGVRDTVITTGWIYGNYSGSTDQEKIRNFVEDAYSNWGTMYFLLAGENETVPFEYRDYGDGETPGDEYYSDFDDDWTMEVFVGRATVSNSTEAGTFIEKVLKYEKDPPRTNYSRDALLVGMDYDDVTHGENLKAHVFVLLPFGFNVTRVFDSYGGNHRTDVLNALNAGQNLVNHTDHSNITVMGTGYYNHGWGIYSSDVDALANDGQLSVVVSTGCHPNHMDYNDCIAEHFVIHNPNRGAVAFTGNTRSGYYYGGDPYSLSNGLDEQWWISLCDRSKYNIGQTLADAKDHFVGDGSAERHCKWTFNLLGEPEMPIWTSQLDSLEVTFPDTVAPDSSFLIHVGGATYHNSLYSARVCLWKQGQVYLTGYTDYSGNASFDPVPSTEGIMLVTATKRNYLPYEGQAYVYPPAYISGDANGDRSVDLADAVYLLNYLFKTGLPPVPPAAGDADCDGQEDLGDVVYLLNYLFKAGTSPCEPD